MANLRSIQFPVHVLLRDVLLLDLINVALATIMVHIVLRVSPGVHGRRAVVAAITRQLLLAIMLVQLDSLARQAVVHAADVVLVIQAPQLRRAVAVLLVVVRQIDVRVRRRTHALPGQRWQHTLLRIPLHLAQHVVVVLLVQVRNLRQSHLVARVLVLVVVQEILAPADNVYGVVLSVPRVPSHRVTSHADQVGRLVGSISDARVWNVVASTRIRHAMLLPIDQSNAVQAVILMMVSFVSSHDQVFLGSFQSDGPDRLRTFARDSEVGHVALRPRSHAQRVVSVVLDVATAGVDVRRQLAR